VNTADTRVELGVDVAQTTALSPLLRDRALSRLADRLVDGDPLEAALELAKTLSRASRPALEAVVRCVDAAFDLPLEDGIAFEAGEENDLFAHGEAKEGLTAFVERRRPEFGS
jgi:enoyl-CoA hydratase